VFSIPEPCDDDFYTTSCVFFFYPQALARDRKHDELDKNHIKRSMSGEGGYQTNVKIAGLVAVDVVAE
jgi:hypothetical protein